MRKITYTCRPCVKEKGAFVLTGSNGLSVYSMFVSEEAMMDAALLAALSLRIESYLKTEP